MQPRTPYYPPENDMTPQNEALPHSPERVSPIVAEAEQIVNDAYDQQRLQQQTGVGRAAVDVRAVASSSPETINQTPQEWAAMLGDAIERTRRKHIDRTMMYGDTTITTSQPNESPNDSYSYPSQDTPRAITKSDVDLAA